MERRSQAKQAENKHHGDGKIGRNLDHIRKRQRQIEPLPDTRKDSPRLQVGRDVHPQAFADHLDKPLNGDQDYVRRWLAQTGDGQQGIQDPKSERRSAAAESSRDYKTARMTSDSLRTYRSFDIETAPHLPTARKRNNSTSDSSILEALPRPQVNFREGYEATPNAIGTQNAHRATRNKRKRVSPSSPQALTSLSSPHQETFERRPRHKTREDKYEPKTVKISKDEISQKRPSKKKLSRSDRKKVTKKGGEDLMRNFSSKNIGQDRLTIRPPQGLGLFHNGRASSPAKRRGIPDLAFSEMEFLQHSYRQTPTQISQVAKSRTKSREKDKKRLERAREEIAEFFQPKRPVLQEMSSDNSGLLISKHRQEKGLMHRREDEGPKRHAYEPRSSSEAPSYLHFQTGSCSGGVKSLIGHKKITYYSPPRPRKAASVSKQSGQATSYMSWSDSVTTPAARVNSHTPFEHRLDSPIPDSVQRSIQKTGIFKDTGIAEWDTSRLSEQSQSTQIASPRNAKILTNENQSSHERHATLPDSPTTRSSVHLPRILGGYHQSSNQRAPQSHLQSEAKPAEVKILSGPKATQDQCSHLLSQQLDLDPSRPQKSKSRSSPPMMDQREPRNGNLTPADRAQVAKGARIRRASSTLPAIRVGSKDPWNGRANQKKLPAAPNILDKAANREDEAEIQDNSIFHTEEPMAPAGKEPRANAHVDEAPRVTKNSIDNTKPGLLDRENSATMLLAPSTLEPRLHTSAPLSCSAVSELHRAERISHLGLPTRGLSMSNGSRCFNIPPSHVTPITELDPLFLRQLNEADRGDYGHYDGKLFVQSSAHKSQEQNPSTILTKIDSNQIAYYENEMLLDNEADDDYLANSRDYRPAGQFDQTHDDMRMVEAEAMDQPNYYRSWYPDLTPIREHSDETEHEYAEDCDWTYHEEQQVAHEPYNYRRPPELDYMWQGDVTNTYEACCEFVQTEDMDVMEGFWRPRSQY